MPATSSASHARSDRLEVCAVVSIPPKIVVTGVAGSGKSTIGAGLAERLGRRFVEGDTLHPDANVAKMAAGRPLEDADRWPWLARVRDVLRRDEPVVVTCSALRRSYRDLLRHAPGVVFVHLEVDVATATERVAGRSGHFMGTEMVESQFAALQPPADDETDNAVVDAASPAEALLDRVVDAVAGLRPGLDVAPLLADGAPDRVITAEELDAHLEVVARAAVLDPGHRRVLLVPPDHTRLHSRAGPITMRLRALLTSAGCEVGVLPALGTHVALGPAETATMFGDGITADELLVHHWRHGLRQLGRIEASEVDVVTEGRYAEPIDVAVDTQLFDGWDLVISIGQVVPHEVIGMANFTKNLIIGLGGAPTIHRSHFVGAVAGMESIMGRATSPVRDLVDAAFDRYVAPVVDVLWLLTVVEDTGGSMTLRGFYAGRGGSMDSGGAAYRAAASLAQTVNLDILPGPLDRVACWLDPAEMHSTWLGNKAIYRTRMAMADDGELVVLAPGVRRFGEDDEIDALIRRHGYRGTPATLAAVETDPELADNLGAAAHLIHGSSEGRFRIVYCTDPDAGGLTQAEVESVGFEWRPLGDAIRQLRVDGSTPGGRRHDQDESPFFHVANPALGLWASSERFTS